ncbi:Protein of unknown function [Gryllus bimaculatus]|nr:Protein of unknown function [Gryllus bimaculatus]
MIVKIQGNVKRETCHNRFLTVCYEQHLCCFEKYISLRTRDGIFKKLKNLFIVYLLRCLLKENGTFLSKKLFSFTVVQITICNGICSCSFPLGSKNRLVNFFKMIMAVHYLSIYTEISKVVLFQLFFIFFKIKAVIFYSIFSIYSLVSLYKFVYINNYIEHLGTNSG